MSAVQLYGIVFAVLIQKDLFVLVKNVNFFILVILWLLV